MQPLLRRRATRAHKRLKATNGPRALGPFWQWENVAALCAGKAKLLCTGDETCAPPATTPACCIALLCWALFRLSPFRQAGRQACLCLASAVLPSPGVTCMAQCCSPCAAARREDAMWSKLYEDNLGAVLVEWRVSNMSVRHGFVCRRCMILQVIGCWEEGPPCLQHTGLSSRSLCRIVAV